MQVATSQQHDQKLPRCLPKPPQALTTHVTQLATVQTSKRPPHNVQRSQAHRFAAGRCGSASDAVRPIAVRATVPAAAGQLPWRHAASLAAGACGALGRAARGRARGRCAAPRHAARRQKGVRGAVCVWVGRRRTRSDRAARCADTIPCRCQPQGRSGALSIAAAGPARSWRVRDLRRK